MDVTRSLVFGNPEILSMGGAGAAYAAGGPGMLFSPAAPASRRMEATAPITSSLVLIQRRIIDRRSVDSLGDPLVDIVRGVDAGFSLGYRNGAGGLLAQSTYYQVHNAWVVVAEGHASAAMTLLDGGLAVGLGPRLLGMRVTSGGGHHDYLGTGVEAGAVLANWHDAWNLALTVRSGVRAGPLNSTHDGVDSVRLPPQLLAGIGWSNLSSIGDDAGIPVRLVADVVIDAPVHQAVALDSLLDGTSVARGRWYTVSPRFGAEVDVWPDRLRLRAGTYLEPSRTTLGQTRPHATGGLELRLFRLNLLQKRIKLNLAWQMGVDYAPRYFHGAWLGINVWQQGRTGGKHQPKERTPPDISVQ